MNGNKLTKVLEGTSALLLSLLSPLFNSFDSRQKERLLLCYVVLGIGCLFFASVENVTCLFFLDAGTKK